MCVHCVLVLTALHNLWRPSRQLQGEGSKDLVHLSFIINLIITIITIITVILILVLLILILLVI